MGCLDVKSDNLTIVPLPHRLMKLNQLLVGLLSTAAIASSVVVGSTAAQSCPFSSKLPTATQNAGQSPQLNNPTTTNSSNLAGIALLSGLLALGGVYWSRRFVQSDSIVNETENTVIPETPIEPATETRELVGSRK